MGGHDLRGALRRTSFLYQDGVMLAATMRAMNELGLMKPGADLDVAGFGYLRVGLRCLASAGWLEEGPGLTPASTQLTWTDAGEVALRHRERYISAGRFLARFTSTAPDAWTAEWDDDTSAEFAAELEAHARWRETATAADEPCVTHLDATLALPALLWLRGARGLAEPEGDIARLLELIGWADAAGRWTDHGRAGLDFVDHLGLVGSYLPMLAKLPDLYSGTDLVRPGTGEWHCHRELNVEASAAAHRRYFAEADQIFLDLFDRPSRPRFIADMGCGDGSWLTHLHELLGDSVTYVGIDASDVALDQARKTLEEAGVSDVLLLPGDISDPDALHDSLAEYGLAMDEGLHIRSFLDHDRTFRGAEHDDLAVPGWASGAYVAPDGRALSAEEVERDLVEHLQRWTPHVRRHGLILLEAHCVAPPVARRNLGALHSVAFDAYHGLSHQYPMEHPAFMRCCRAAGLRPSSHVERRYPTTRPFVAVSLNRFVGTSGPLLRARPAGAPRQDDWIPAPDADLDDGRGLHRLMYTDGDVGLPRTWSSGATGAVVAGALKSIERRVEHAQPGDAVRVMDYGAGTGLAAIELLKACRDREVEERLTARGATFELHLVDIPGSWFAKGYELLGDDRCTRFHALRDDNGAFRSLTEITDGQPMNAVMANMVFHLLTPRAMERAAADLAAVLAPGGSLHFSSPDLGPASDHSVLFHAPNRMLREQWLAALDAPDPETLAPPLRAAVAAVDADERAGGQARADRRILPDPPTASAVDAAFAPHLQGTVEQRSYELLAEESLLTMLVPSNQEEFLPELADPVLRESVVQHLMHEVVHPLLMSSAAGTALGMNVQWTLGHYVKP